MYYAFEDFVMKQYEVTVKYYDYIFTQATVTRYATINAVSVDDVKAQAHLKFGDLIEIVEVVEIK